MVLIDKEELKKEIRRHVLYANPQDWALNILCSVEPIITEAPAVECRLCESWREAIGPDGKGNGRFYCYYYHKLARATHACDEFKPPLT